MRCHAGGEDDQQPYGQRPRRQLATTALCASTLASSRYPFDTTSTALPGRTLGTLQMVKLNVESETLTDDPL
jgi:hypothetical protein